MSKRKKRQKKKLYSILFALIIAICIYITSYKDMNESYSKPDSNIVSTDLTIYFFDVGQADSILVANNNQYMLIDAGNNEDGPLLVKYIKEELGIKKINYVVGTHPHEDHIGGLDDIINNFEIDNVLLPDAITTTKTFEDVIDAIDSKKLEITIPEIDSSFKVGEADVKVLHTGTDTTDLNNTSIVLKLTFGNKNYLFTGDATSKVEELITDKVGDIDVLKVGHHGSAYSTTNKFLLATSPEYAIISVAKDNSYNHPSKDTLNRLNKFTKNIYLTSELGTIILTSNGDAINITNIKTNTNG